MTAFGTEHVILRKQLSANYILRTEFRQDDSFTTAQFTILILTRKNSAIENQMIKKTMRIITCDERQLSDYG